MDIRGYEEMRSLMVEQNENLVGIVLNSRERKLNEKLKEMKAAFKADCGGEIPYDIPVLTDQRIWNSELYHFMKKLPKGSDLHVHGTSLLPIYKLIDYVIDQPKLLIHKDAWILGLTKDRQGQEGWMPLGEAIKKGFVDRDELRKRWSMEGRQHGENQWQRFEALFEYTDAIDYDVDVLRDYYVRALNNYLENGIYHVEIHGVLATSMEITRLILEAVMAGYKIVRKEHPELTVSFIGCSMKMFSYSEEDTAVILQNTLEAQKTFRDIGEDGSDNDFVLGFDMVNEEDSSRPLKAYAPMMIEMKEKNPNFKYFLHCGESLDAESDHLFDAYLIRADRVGHGMNLYRYPNLLKAYAEREICLECCPISNQALGYVRDIRLHPGMEYLKRGVTIALCSDDPISMEYEPLTDDFFAAVVCWNLGVAEIKQLCLNSIMYSGLDTKRRSALLRHWKACWEKLIDEYIE